MLNGGVLLGSQLGGSEPSNDGFSYARYWDGSSFSWTKTPTFSSVTIDEGGTSSLVITETGDAGIVFQAPGPQEVLGLRAYGDGTVNIGASIGDFSITSEDQLTLQSGTIDDILFVAGGSTRVRIDSTGDVLLTSGAQLFWGDNTDSFIQSFTSTGAIYYDSVGGTGPYHRFRTDSTDKFFIYPTYLESRIPLLIKEAAAGVASAATYGQLWVKNTTPCELWFTDDAGTSTKIV